MQAGDTALGEDRRADVRMRDATLEDLTPIVEEVEEYINEVVRDEKEAEQALSPISSGSASREIRTGALIFEL